MPHLAVPALTADLKPSSSQLLWIVDIYGFLLAGLLVTIGMLGDRIAGGCFCWAPRRGVADAG